MATPNPIKDKLPQVYYTERIQSGKFAKIRRHFLHSKDSGLWAYVRDLSQAEVVANQTVNIKINLIFQMNWNERIITNWNDPIVLIFNGRTYRTNQKPDEFEYRKGDIRIQAEAFVDTEKYDEDVFEDE